MSLLRNIIFRTDSTITKPFTLLLTCGVTPPTEIPNMVAWRVIHFSGSGQFSVVTYDQQQLQFGAEQSLNATVTENISIGQQTDLVLVDGMAVFTIPVDGVPSRFTANNKTGVRKDISFGYQDSRYTFNPLLGFVGVENGASPQVEYNPILHVYVTSKYKQGQLISQLPPAIMSQELTQQTPYQLYTLVFRKGNYLAIPDKENDNNL